MSRLRPLQSLWLVYRILEMRDGAVFRTTQIGDVWVDVTATLEERKQIARNEGGDMLVPLSTSDPRVQTGANFRRKPE